MYSSLTGIIRLSSIGVLVLFILGCSRPNSLTNSSNSSRNRPAQPAREKSNFDDDKVPFLPPEKLPQARGALQELEGISFSPTGTPLLPTTLIHRIIKGELSPLLQAALLVRLLNACVANSVKLAPIQKESYVSAKTKFDKGTCSLGKCYATNIIVGYLASLSPGRDPIERKVAKQTVLGLVNAAQSQKCAGDTSTSAFDPNILKIVQAIQE